MTKTERELLIAHRELNILRKHDIQRIPFTIRAKYSLPSSAARIAKKEIEIIKLEAKE